MVRKCRRITIYLILSIYLITSISFWCSNMKNGPQISSCTFANTRKQIHGNIFEIRMTGEKDNASSPTGMWTVQPAGRLGNLMGEYATLYALAKLHRRQAYILPRMHSELSGMFKIRLPVLQRMAAKQVQWKMCNIDHNWMSKEYYNMSGEYVKITGYPYSWTFYHHLREEIVQEFTFHDFVKKRTNYYLNNIQGNRSNVTFIGVHVRRGDYVEIMKRTKKGVVANKEYLQKAMNYFRNKYKHSLFVVTSNGMDWCKKNIDNSLGDVHFVGDGKEEAPFRDFALLAHCNHTIMTIGTFGYFAAYLAGGETIYLSNYTLPGYPRITNFTYETAFLPEWIGIPANLSPLLKNKNNSGFSN